MNRRSLFFVIVISGIVQWFILDGVETPSYWEDDGGTIRFMAAVFSQPWVCLIGFGVAMIVEGIFKRKADELLFSIKRILNQQINALKYIKQKIGAGTFSYRTSEKIVDLLSLLSDQEIKKEYASAIMSKDSELLSEIAEIVAQNSVHIEVKGKTLPEVGAEVYRMIQKKHRILEEITQAGYSSKDCSLLKQKLEAIQLGSDLEE